MNANTSEKKFYEKKDTYTITKYHPTKYLPISNK